MNFGSLTTTSRACILKLQRNNTKMAEEKYDESTTNLDDTSVLSHLLHVVRGLSPVSSLQYELVDAEDGDVEYAA